MPDQGSAAVIRAEAVRPVLACVKACSHSRRTDGEFEGARPPVISTDLGDLIKRIGSEHAERRLEIETSMKRSFW